MEYFIGFMAGILFTFITIVIAMGLPAGGKCGFKPPPMKKQTQTEKDEEFYWKQRKILNGLAKGGI